eukprot:1175650-Prorocentrum_minimum.AAC.1
MLLRFVSSVLCGAHRSASSTQSVAPLREGCRGAAEGVSPPPWRGPELCRRAPAGAVPDRPESPAIGSNPWNIALAFVGTAEAWDKRVGSAGGSGRLLHLVSRRLPKPKGSGVHPKLQGVHNVGNTRVLDVRAPRSGSEASLASTLDRYFPLEPSQGLGRDAIVTDSDKQCPIVAEGKVLTWTVKLIGTFSTSGSNPAARTLS